MCFLTGTLQSMSITFSITVKCLYFAGRIFRGFRELACIREIIFIEIYMSLPRVPHTSVIHTRTEDGAVQVFRKSSQY